MTISEFLVSNGIPFQENVLLSEKSWIKTGGLCAYWVTPVDIGQLKCACRFLYQNDAQFDVVGHTSNIFSIPHIILRLLSLLLNSIILK